MKHITVIGHMAAIGLALNMPVSGGMKEEPQSERLIQWEYLQGDIGGVWEAFRAKDVRNGKPEHIPAWAPVTLPHCFNSEDAVAPNKIYYQGPGWYRTVLELDNPYEKGRTLLHFEGAGQKTDVYVGLVHAGRHVGGYDEWTIDITEAIKSARDIEPLKSKYNGKIPIAIRCDNSRDLEMMPSDLSDFNLYGGLYRHVNLEYVPALSLSRIRIGAAVDSSGSQASVNIGALLRNEGDDVTAEATVEIMAPDGNIVAKNTKKVHSEADLLELFKIDLENPLLWSPDTPHLYTCSIALTSDSGRATRTELFGFRHFEFLKHGPFLLNGERLLLRGTHRHEDHAGVAAAMTDDMIRTELEMMKEMGVNFIRLGHYQQSRVVLDLCDRLGILVWEEIPWCRGGVGGNAYKDQGRRMLTNMIQQHRNHPSVIIWGLGNENDWPGDTPEYDAAAVRTYMTELNTLAHQLDPSRKTAIRRCEPCKDIVDVYSPSIWAGWYRGKFTSYREYTKKAIDSVDHFLHVEWGASHHARRHSEDPDRNLDRITGDGVDERDGDASLHGGPPRVSKDGDWSETYACNLIDWHLKEQEQMPYLTGTAYWPFKDFSTPIRPENPVPYVNQKGVVERDFAKKESFYVFQSYWTAAPMIHIYGHTWPIRWGSEGEEKMVKVYSNCEEVELLVNGESQGTRQRNSQDYPAAGLRWKVKFDAGNNVIRALGIKGGITVEDEIRIGYETRKWGNPAGMELRSDSPDDSMDTTWVTVQLNDEQGIPCLDAKNVVHFSLIGDGELIDNLGTSTGSRTVQVCNGVTRIQVRMNGAKNIVAVKSPGLKTQFITLNAASREQ